MFGRYHHVHRLSADPSLITPVIIAGVAALHAGVFACADTALTSLGSARLSALAKEGKARTKGALERAVKNRATIQARYLAGRVVSLCIAAGSAAYALDRLRLEATLTIAVAAGALLALAIIIELSASLGRRAADWVTPVCLFMLWPYEIVLAPLGFLTGGFTFLFKWTSKTDPKVTETEVEMMVAQQERAGNIEQEDAELIRNVLEFSDLSARDAMVPRTKVVAIKLDTPLEAVLKTVTDTGHSRYPVYEEDLDHIVGLLHAKDLFRVIKRSWRPPAPRDSSEESGGPDSDPSGEDTPSQRMARLYDIVRSPVKEALQSQPLTILLREMRNDRQHLAIVVDEFGGTSGIVTLEDILEEIVGDIQDEYDQEAVPIMDMGHGRLIAQASVLVSELSSYLGQDLDPDAKYDSLGGMLTDKIGSVPDEGTTVSLFGMRFIVRESDEKHIETVEIARTGSLADTSGSHRAAH